MIIENSFDGKKILKLNHNGKCIYLGSKYNMTREIENFRKRITKVNKNYEIIVFGASGGSWLEEFAEDFKDRDIVFVEPLEELKSELEVTINSLNMNIKVLSLDSEEVKDDLKNSIDKRFIEFIVFSNYDLIFPKEGYNLKKIIHDIVMDKTINENTVITFSKDWFKNYLKNLPYILNGERLNQYKNVYHNKPAIIVSAGPSLEKNINLLKGHEDKFIIITGIRTLSTLKKEGINCDFACVIDGSEAMYEVSKGALNYNTPLFYSESANKDIIREYRGKKVYFTSPSFYNMNLTLGGFGADILFQGGSVAHSCTAIAHYLGCNPIVFIGQDLAYTNNQIHAKNATVQGEKLKTDKYDIFVKDIYGIDIPTSYSLDSFRKTFEDFIKQYNNITYINATEGGANIHGTEIKTLKEVIEKFNEKIDKSYINEFKESNLDVNLVMKNLEHDLKEIKKIKKFTEEAIFENENLLHKFLKDNKAYKKSLNRLDYIDEKFELKQKELLLMNTLFAPIIKEIDIAFYDEKLGNFDDEIEHIKFIADKGRTLYEGINSSIEFAIPFIEETISELEELVNEK